MPPRFAAPAQPLQPLHRALGHLTAAVSLLVVPLAVLLCGQWPLREWLHAYSREANDLAQLVFGAYVSVAMVYATRSQAHLTPDVLARHYPARWRSALLRGAALCVVLPWAGFILYAAAPMAWQSVQQWERFPDTFDPGYFLLKTSVMLLAALAILQALLDIFSPEPDATH